MAWTTVSISQTADLVASDMGFTSTSTTGGSTKNPASSAMKSGGTATTWAPVTVASLFSPPGMDGYNVEYVRPVSGSVQGVGGASARPSSGFLYPRGDS